MHRTAVLNVVGLTRAMLRWMPRTASFASTGSVATIAPVLPAVTCSVQATYLTGTLPSEHGIVGNGWYDRTDCEVKFWKQSDRLVSRPRLWELARSRDPAFTCANLFWWFAMYSSADCTVTPRPMYPADGRKLPDVWTHPPQLRDTLQRELGQFPLFKFWGPMASIESSRWIANAALRVDTQSAPTLSLIYLPHLDYALQKHGPTSPEAQLAAREVDEVVGGLIDHFDRVGTRLIILSEYGIEPVDRPIHLNRVLRQHGLLAVRRELGRELLDPGASAAFAVADHQVAHVYVNDRSRVAEVAGIVASLEGVERVLDGDAMGQAGIAHPRSGDLVAVARPGAWFTYYFWERDEAAPDFARTVDIHRKPGYDPVELLLDPRKPLVGARIAWKLARRKLGFRTLLDVIPLDATLVKGSHGRISDDEQSAAVFISRGAPRGRLRATEVCGEILGHVFDDTPSRT